MKEPIPVFIYARQQSAIAIDEKFSTAIRQKIIFDLKVLNIDTRVNYKNLLG